MTDEETRQQCGYRSQRQWNRQVFQYVLPWTRALEHGPNSDETERKNQRERGQAEETKQRAAVCRRAAACLACEKAADAERVERYRPCRQRDEPWANFLRGHEADN